MFDLPRILILSLLLGITGNTMAKTKWEKIKKPTQHNPQCVGTYTNGCVLGGRALPLKGEGYEVIRTKRNRYYGHPHLISYLQNLGRMVNEIKLGTMLIGDMSMPAGGRFTKGHSSHQTGLDADIWLKLPKGNLESGERENPSPNNVVDFDKFDVNKNWNPKYKTLIKLAASDSKVQRIFVNPAIKRKLCETENNKSWLRKVRPWYGHNYHIHVRLKCPKGSKFCIGQKDVARGSGCGKEVMTWDWRGKKKVKSKKKAKKIIPTPPPACLSLIN